MPGRAARPHSMRQRNAAVPEHPPGASRANNRPPATCGMLLGSTRSCDPFGSSKMATKAPPATGSTRPYVPATAR